MPSVKWRAIVSDNNDPEKRFRVRAKVPDGFQDPYTGQMEPTDWLLPAHQGVRYAPPVGAGVWVEFEVGPGVDHNGIWSGEYPSIPDGISEIINVARDPLAGLSPYGRGVYQVETPAFNNEIHADAPAAQTLAEPTSFQATSYPNNAVVHSPLGKALVELDDSASGRIHMHTGDFYHEVTGDGVESRRVTNKTEFVMESEHRVIEGPQVEHVAGVAVKHYEDDYAAKVDGSAYVSAGNAKVVVGPATADIGKDAGGLDLSVTGDINIEAVRADIGLMAKALMLMSIEELRASSNNLVLEALGALGTVTIRTPTNEVSVSPATGVSVDYAVPVPATPETAVVCMSLAELTAFNIWAKSVYTLLTSLLPVPNPAFVPPPAFSSATLLSSAAVKAGV